MKQAPHWLPYGLRSWVDQCRINRALRCLDQTRPYPAVPPQKAQAEVHMLLCKRDLRLGALALKSLLRFDEVRFAVSVTSDGSLNPKDRAWFDGHIPGCRWLDWPMRDARLDRLLGPWPRLAAVYRSDFQMIAKLLHPILLARCPRVVQIDSDTAFFKPPDRILEFCRGDDARPLYLHDHQDEAKVISATVQQAFADLETSMLSGQQSWRLPHRFFNAGLLVYRPDQMDIAVAERYVGWKEDAPQPYTTGRLNIWFGSWTLEQTCYHVMYALADPPPEPLGDEYHLGGQPGHVFNHFLRHYLVRDTTLAMLRGLICQL